MKTQLLLLVVLAALPYYVQGISINPNASTTTASLWSLSDRKDDITNQIHQELEYYAEYCCQIVHKKTHKYCWDKQMGYWANIPDTIPDNNKVNYLKSNFDPLLLINDPTKQDLVCNCVRQNGICREDTNVVGQQIYPLFAFGQGKSITHTEQILLPQILNVARDKKSRNEPQTFYLYSNNSPCSKDLDNKGSCSKNIFQATYDNFFDQNKRKFHTMNTGFYQWYIYPKDSSILENRERFCATIENWKYSKDFQSVDFKDALKFRKWYKEPGDDEYYHDTLKDGDC